MYPLGQCVTPYYTVFASEMLLWCCGILPIFTPSSTKFRPILSVLPDVSSRDPGRLHNRLWAMRWYIPDSSKLLAPKSADDAAAPKIQPATRTILAAGCGCSSRPVGHGPTCSIHGTRVGTRRTKSPANCLGRLIAAAPEKITFVCRTDILWGRYFGPIRRPLQIHQYLAHFVDGSRGIAQMGGRLRFQGPFRRFEHLSRGRQAVFWSPSAMNRQCLSGETGPSVILRSIASTNRPTFL